MMLNVELGREADNAALEGLADRWKGGCTEGFVGGSVEYVACFLNLPEY
jgi:hypothetical protein